MRRYLLDSTPLAAFMNDRPAARALIDPWLRAGEVATSVLVYAEVVEYLRMRQNFAEHRGALRDALKDIYPYSLTYPILERYSEVRRQLRPPYGPGLIGDIDTLIAATALQRNLTVVTTDGDFQRIPGLTVMLLPRR
jgi:predicted nucleic acid-binding protein